jgi:hypothetical protein
VDAAKAAVAEHHDDVAALRLLRDVRHDDVHVGQMAAFLPEAFKSCMSFSRLSRSSAEICSSRGTIHNGLGWTRMPWFSRKQRTQPEKLGRLLGWVSDGESIACRTAAAIFVNFFRLV